MKRVLGKEGRVIRVRQRRRDEGEKAMIVEFCKRDARGILESRGKIRLCWEIRADEDLKITKRRNK